MCQAFSAIVMKNGDVKWKLGLDSHSEILKHFGIPDNEDDPKYLKFARVEITPENRDYLNPDNWKFQLDEDIKPKWFTKSYELFAFEAHKLWLTELDKILIHKLIIHPFRDIEPPKKITKKHLDLLKKWASAGDSVRASVRASVGNSVRDSVRDSVGDSVGDSVWDSVEDSIWNPVGFSVGNSVRNSVRNSVGASVRDSIWNSVWNSIWNSVRNSVRNSVGDSVGDSVWNSIWNSVRAYIGTFFNLSRDQWKYTENIKCKGYPFQPAVDLWMMGLVPSFDGKVWRLHGGKDAKVLWEGEVK